MVQRINHQSDVFTHITIDIVRTLQKLWCLIDQVGGEDCVNESFLICLVNFSSPLVKSPKLQQQKYVLLCAVSAGVQHLKYCLRRNHIIQDNYIFSFYRRAKEFVRNDRVASIHDFGVVTTLIEHTHIKV